MKASRPRLPRPAASDPTHSPNPPRGTLFIVATPIGNLEDITLRALRILREVSLIAAEDTRRTGNLLRHYQIATPLLSLHEHNERARIDRVRRELAMGRSIALVSDAGTPGISDPGGVLVRQLRSEGYRIEPIPGASAVTAAISAAGLDASAFAFVGFPPSAGLARKRWLNHVLSRRSMAVILFEAPHRIRRLLAELVELLGEQQIIVARELTKLYEEWFVGSAEEVAGRLPEDRGEYVLVIPPRIADEERAEPLSDDIVGRTFGQLTENGVGPRREAIRQTADLLGTTPKAVFAALERVKKP